MLTYTSGRNLYGKLTGNSTTSNLSDGDIYVNEEIRRILTLRPWHFLLKTISVTITASNQAIGLPADCSKVEGFYQTIGTERYVTTEVKTREEWDRLNSSSHTSTYPTRHFVTSNQILLWPTPSANGTGTLIYKRKAKDLSVADYTAGTVALTNGETTVTGSGTTFTAGMVGRYIRVPESQDGDGFWYEITGFTSTTVLTIGSPYQGATITGKTYIIGQTSLIPEDFQQLPYLRAAERYFTLSGQNLSKAEKYKADADDLEARLVLAHSSKSNNPVLEDGLASKPALNSNLFPTITT